MSISINKSKYKVIAKIGLTKGKSRFGSHLEEALYRMEFRRPSETPQNMKTPFEFPLALEFNQKDKGLNFGITALGRTTR